jgi:predicted dienelactone hydrolase
MSNLPSSRSRCSTRLPVILGMFPALMLAMQAWSPARAIEQLQLNLPLLETEFTVNLQELRDPEALLEGRSDLAELDRASDGAITKRIRQVFLSPLPLNIRGIVERSEGSALLDQALLMLSALGEVDGLPERVDSERFATTISGARATGTLSLLDVLEAIPGEQLTVEMGRFRLLVERLRRQQAQGEAMARQLPSATPQPPLRQRGPSAVRRLTFSIPVSHRSVPLEVVAFTPQLRGNQRLVVVSHGLWDGPESFEGWASHLASHGYTILLPVHPGSDKQQQRATLAGDAPPPSPEELRLRPLDVSASIDAAARGIPALETTVDTDTVVALGHSWGATTVLQLLGATPSDQKLRQQCDDPRHPNRNLSWVLQCSFLQSADRAGGTDPRIKAGIAVSPPARLLFDRESGKAMGGTLLMVSGTKDWVVPSGPEALVPMARLTTIVGGDHQLVLAEGGDHFNLRSRLEDGGGPLRGLILAWVNRAFQGGAAGSPAARGEQPLPPDGWGDERFRLINATAALKQVDTQ